MLDIKFIRKNIKKVKQGCKNKNVKIDIDKFLKIDKKRLENLVALQDIRTKKNKANKEIGQTNNQKDKKAIILRMQELDRNNDLIEKKFRKLDKEFNELLLGFPNMPLDNVPIGKSDEDNVVLREVGKKTKFDFEPKNHLEIGTKLKWIDTERAAKVSGSRFAYLKREAVLLEFALIRLVFDVLEKKDFIPIITPVMMKKEMARGMGYLEQSDQEEAYYIPKDNLYLAGTTEQPIGTMHSNETFKEEDLPKRYIGFSTWFRREAGSYGKDTIGIFRVHQFDGIEMFSFSKPEESKKEHLFLLSMEEKLMKLLKIPYRVIQICTGDLGHPAASKYDIESWIPSQKKYRETHSVSTCTDFQARRLNIRYKTKKGETEFVHTLNGTAFAIGRILIAIIENYQQKDGTVKIPKILKQYM